MKFVMDWRILFEFKFDHVTVLLHLHDKMGII